MFQGILMLWVLYTLNAPRWAVIFGWISVIIKFLQFVFDDKSK